MVQKDAFPTSPPEVHVVLGGGGYVGYNLGMRLHSLGHKVVLFDVHQSSLEIPEDVTFIQGDIRKQEDVEKALSGADCVYHMASYGMSGREQLNRKLTEEVNVGGTHNVIQLCQKLGIGRLVYTSTFNVVFGGQKIENGDESLPYFPIDKHPDNYSRTKSLAEMAVLEADNSPLDVRVGDGRLHTCALRLAGIYGPGEQRHFPRIVNVITRGFFRVTYGEDNSLVEFLHVDNLVEAHVLAGQALSPRKHYVASGQAYFISDGKPINNFEFFRPLVIGLGYKYPSIRVPLSIIYFFAFLTEMVHALIGPIVNFQPLLTRAEVFKTGVTHYFNLDKARKELDYAPGKQNDLTEVVQWFVERGYGKPKLKSRETGKSRFMTLCINVILMVAVAVVILSFLPSVR